MKLQKKEDVIRMILRNNTCNRDLGNRVETGAFQFFECPPMLFSPTNPGTPKKTAGIANNDNVVCFGGQANATINGMKRSDSEATIQ